MMPASSFLGRTHDSEFLTSLLGIIRQLNQQKLRRNLEARRMAKQQYSRRKQRTRTLIQLGGLVQKSGLLEWLEITPGMDLQDFENIHKAAQVLGFLMESMEKTDAKPSEWQKIGERKLRYGSIQSLNLETF